MKTTSHIRDAVVAFAEAFPELVVAPSEENRLVLLGNTSKRKQHYLNVARMAAHLLDTPGLENGYYIGNHIVRMDKGNACQIDKEFQKADTNRPAGSKEPKLKVYGLSEKVLVIVPVLPPASATGEFKFPIELEARAAALKGKLMGGAKEQEESEKPKARAQGAIVRLYHLRDATAVANVFKGDKSEPVKVIGPDLLLIDPPDGKIETITAIRRILALLDLPRPQIGLQVWSMQVTADGTQASSARLDKFRHDINEFNQVLQDSLDLGWAKVMDLSKDQNALDGDFRRYIAEDFLTCSRDDRYCLGYQDAFLESAPSLTRLLLFLAAFEHPVDPIGKVTEEMGKAGESIGVPTKFRPQFTNFRHALSQLLRDDKVASFRTAIVDFLFHYKWATLYPREFVPYDLTLSAHVLDSMLTPIHDAFARDLEAFVEQLQEQGSYKELLKLQQKSIKKERTEKFYSSGLMRVTTLSGTQAKSSGTVSNYFDITSPLTLQDLLKENEILKKGLPDVLSDKEALLAGIAANLLAQPRVIAEVGRGMTLTVTPVGLETAAAAELRVDLVTGEDSAPSVYSGSADKKRGIDRVTKHTVSDTVRVESLKLFEISTFGMDLEYRKDFILPIIGDAWHAVFGGVPGLNALFRWPGRSLQSKSNRSMAVVSAVVVPTAMDLAYSIRFESDRELVPGGTQRIKNAADLFVDARAFHKLKMRCMRGSKEPVCGGEDKGKSLKMSDIIGDVEIHQ